MQLNCNKEEFNAVSHSPRYFKARTGIIGNNEDDCTLCDSRIGFGTGGYPDDSSSRGNEARHFPENAKKHIKTMGYILVQQKETYLG